MKVMLERRQSHHRAEDVLVGSSRWDLEEG